LNQLREELFNEQGNDYEEIVFINLLGASVAPPGKTLEDVNLIPATSAMEGLIRFRNQKGKRCAFKHISSVAATVLDDSTHYSKVRNLADKKLLEKAKSENISFTSLRPGLIFNELQKDRMINMGHPYSPEQLSALPFQLILASGNQKMQPVFEKDLVEATLNAAELEHQEIIDALGPEIITQKEMMEFFVKLSQRKFRPLHIPIEVAKTISEFCPKGRFAPYAMDLFKALENPSINKPLCDKKFKKVLNRTPLSMRDVYYIIGQEPLILAKPPVIDHMKKITYKLLSSKDARSEILTTLWNHKAKLVQGFYNSLSE
jgi:hypothetical protein